MDQPAAIYTIRSTLINNIILFYIFSTLSKVLIIVWKQNGSNTACSQLKSHWLISVNMKMNIAHWLKIALSLFSYSCCEKQTGPAGPLQSVGRSPASFIVPSLYFVHWKGKQLKVDFQASSLSLQMLFGHPLGFLLYQLRLMLDTIVVTP